MSSRLLPSGDPRRVERVAWRQVSGKGGEATTEAPSIDWERKLLDAERDTERRVAEARAAGHREGEAAGRAQATAELQTVLERAARSVEELAAMRDRLRHEAEMDLVKLAMAVARRIVHRELSIDPDAMQGLIRAALDRLKAQEVSRVRIHPTFAGLLSGIFRAHSLEHPPEVLSDATLDRGALVFETARGNLDASVEAQLEEIERGLADRLRRRT
jgi:flagellar assembly protein FliH